MKRLLFAASALALLAGPALAQSAADELFYTAADQMMVGPGTAETRATLERVLRAGDLDPANRTEARALLGAMLLKGTGGATDPARGLSLLRQASSAGWANADYEIGLAYLKGLGVAQNTSMALTHFDRAYDSSEHYDAAYEAAKIRLASRAQPFEVERAILQLEHAGNGQNAEALALMAWSMETGTNTDFDLDGAIDVYLMAEAQGHPAATAALNRLAQSLAERGDEQFDAGNDAAAFLNYSRACASGHGGGCWGEALSHLNGYGTPKDETAAQEPARIACQLKVDPEACHAFAHATLSFYGGASPADHRQAFNIYRDRCDEKSDSPDYMACYSQAYMMIYENFDVPNYIEGRNLMVRTCMMGGNQQACDIGLPLFNRDMAPTLAALPKQKKKSGWFGQLLGEAAGGLATGFAAMGQVQTSGYTSSYSGSSSSSSYSSSSSSYQDKTDWNNAIRSITSYGTGYQTTCRPGNPYC